MARNQIGGHYAPGRPTPLALRQEIVDMYDVGGFSMKEISRAVGVTDRGVSKIIHHSHMDGTVQPFSIGGKNPWLI